MYPTDPHPPPAIGWIVAMALLSAGLASIPPAVFDTLPPTDLTPAGFLSLWGVLAPLARSASQLLALYLSSLLIALPVAWLQRGRFAPAAFAAAVFVALVGLIRFSSLAVSGWGGAMWSALLVALCPALAYGIAAFAEKSRARRLYLLGIVGFATAAPLELYLIRWQRAFALEPIALLDHMDSVVLWALAVGLTAAPALWLAPGRPAKAATATAVALMTLFVGDAAAVSAARWTDRIAPANIRGPKHIILLSADTLRADAIAPYSPRAVTPSLGALAADSVVFEDAYSPAPWTLPAITSVLTGFAPEVHGVGMRREDAGLPTAAEILSAHGYRTAVFGGNPILRPGGDVLDARKRPSFDFYSGVADWRVFAARRYGNSSGAKAMYASNVSQYFDGGTTAEQTEYVLRWLEDNHDQPFFLWSHFYDPHWPLAPPRAFLPDGVAAPDEQVRRIIDAPQVRLGIRQMNEAERDWVSALYAAEVRYLDHAIGQIIERLKQLGIYDDSLIVFFSDHGEELWEHRRFGHGHSLYPEVLRVPLLWKLPGGGQAVARGRASTQAILPTVLEEAGISYQNPEGWLPSLSPRLQQPGGRSDEPLFASAVELFESQETVLFGDYQLIRYVDTDEVELFHTVQDPGSHHSVASRHPEAVRRGLALLAGQREQAARTRSAIGLSDEAAPKWDDETLKRLRNLGYLQ